MGRGTGRGVAFSGLTPSHLRRHLPFTAKDSAKMHPVEGWNWAAKRPSVNHPSGRKRRQSKPAADFHEVLECASPLALSDGRAACIVFRFISTKKPWPYRPYKNGTQMLGDPTKFSSPSFCGCAPGFSWTSRGFHVPFLPPPRQPLPFKFQPVRHLFPASEGCYVPEKLTQLFK